MDVPPACRFLMVLIPLYEVDREKGIFFIGVVEG
jgi:hypothetical protein